VAIYNFTGANGDPLPAGLTARNGTFEILNNRGVVSGSNPSGAGWVFTGEGATDGTFDADFQFANSGSAVGLVFRYADNDNFWMLACVAAQSVLRLFKRESGSFSTVTDTAFSPTYGQSYNLRVDLSGTSIECFLDDVSQFSTTNSFNQSETGYGGRFNQAVTTDTIDNLDIQDPSSDAIVIDTQDYRIWQRNGSDEASVTISGTYTGTPTTIERSVDGGAYTTAVATPSGGVWSDTFTLATGQYDIVYRFSNDVGVTDTVTYISVGDVFVGSGQSNMSGRGTSNQSYSPSASGVRAVLFGNDDNYKQLSDPTDDATAQVDQVSDDLLESPGLSNPTGSWFMRFANEWLANSNVPIGFIPCALGATSASQWAKTSTDRVGGLNLYESMERRIDSVGGCAAVLYEQGEQDANNGTGTTAAAYSALLDAFIDDVFADFGVDTFVIPLHEISASGYDGNGTTTGQAPIRQAQINTVLSNSNARIGAPLTDIDLSGGDGIHFKDDADLNTVGNRMYGSYTGSDLSISITGIPNGSYRTVLLESGGAVVFDTSIVYSSGSATATGISSTAGTALTGYVIDNESPHVNGAVITGTTA
jgi:hypothetical protein